MLNGLIFLRSHIAAVKKLFEVGNGTSLGCLHNFPSLFPLLSFEQQRTPSRCPKTLVAFGKYQALRDNDDLAQAGSGASGA